MPVSSPLVMCSQLCTSDSTEMILWHSCADPENSVKGSCFLNHQRISQRAVLRPEGPNCFSRGSAPVFLGKPITTCGYPGGNRTPPPLGPPMTLQQIPLSIYVSLAITRTVNFPYGSTNNYI